MGVEVEVATPAPIHPVPAADPIHPVPAASHNVPAKPTALITAATKEPMNPPVPTQAPIHPSPAAAPDSASTSTAPSKKRGKLTPVKGKGRKSGKDVRKKGGDVDVPNFKAKKVTTPGTSRPAAKVTLN